MTTQREFADHVGISQQAVSNLVNREVLRKGGSLDDWRLDYCRHLREQAAGRGAVDGELDLAKERALLARSQRTKLDLEIAEMERRLIPAEEVEREWIDILSAVRAKLLALPSRAAPQVVGLTASEANETLRLLVNEALTELGTDGGSNGPDSGSEGEDSQDHAPAPRDDGDAVGRRKAPAKPRRQRRTRTVSE